MIIRKGQTQLTDTIQPLLFFNALTLRTVSVATAFVNPMSVSTISTGNLHAPQCRRFTNPNGADEFYLFVAGAVLSDVLLTELSKDFSEGRFLMHKSKSLMGCTMRRADCLHR